MGRKGKGQGTTGRKWTERGETGWKWMGWCETRQEWQEQGGTRRKETRTKLSPSLILFNQTERDDNYAYP